MARGLDFWVLTDFLTLFAVTGGGSCTVVHAAVAISGGPHHVKKGEPEVDTEDVTGIVTVNVVGLETAGECIEDCGMAGMNGRASML